MCIVIMWLTKCILLSSILVQITICTPIHKRSILGNKIIVHDINDIKPIIINSIEDSDENIIIEDDLFAIVTPAKNDVNLRKRNIDNEEKGSPFNRLDLLEAFIARNFTTTPKPKVKVPVEVTQTRIAVPELSEIRRLPPLKLPKRLDLSTRKLTSEEKLERTNRAFDRILRFVSLVGQVDSYISDQARLAVRKLAAMYNEEDRFRNGH